MGRVKGIWAGSPTPLDTLPGPMPLIPGSIHATDRQHHLIPANFSMLHPTSHLSAGLPVCLSFPPPQRFAEHGGSRDANPRQTIGAGRGRPRFAYSHLSPTAASIQDFQKHQKKRDRSQPQPQTWFLRGFTEMEQRETKSKDDKL